MHDVVFSFFRSSPKWLHQSACSKFDLPLPCWHEKLFLSVQHPNGWIYPVMNHINQLDLACHGLWFSQSVSDIPIWVSNFRILIESLWFVTSSLLQLCRNFSAIIVWLHLLVVHHQHVQSIGQTWLANLFISHRVCVPPSATSPRIDQQE